MANWNAWAMWSNIPKNPVGATTPSSFSYEKRAVDEAFWATGAKAAAAAMRDEARMRFMLTECLTIIKVVNYEQSVAFVFFVFQNKNRADLYPNSRTWYLLSFKSTSTRTWKNFTILQVTFHYRYARGFAILVRVWWEGEIRPCVLVVYSNG